jgi:hypothetical protein
MSGGDRLHNLPSPLIAWGVPVVTSELPTIGQLKLGEFTPPDE